MKYHMTLEWFVQKPNLVIWMVVVLGNLRFAHENISLVVMSPRIQLQKAWWLLPEKQGHCAGHNTALLSVGFCVHSLGRSLHCNSASAPASFLTGVSVFHKHPTKLNKLLAFPPLKYVAPRSVLQLEGALQFAVLFSYFCKFWMPNQFHSCGKKGILA